MKFTTLILTSLLLSLNSFAAGSGVIIGEVQYGGTGCKVGTLKAEQNDSSLSLIILKEFKLSARKSTDRKACNIAIPLEVPKGIQVGIGPIDEINGFHSLPSSATKLSVKQEVFFAGTKGKIVSYQKKGSVVGAMKIENSTLLKNLRWSTCGQSVNLRVNLTAQLDNPNRKQAFVTLDSINILKTGHLYWRQCQ